MSEQQAEAKVSESSENESGHMPARPEEHDLGTLFTARVEEHLHPTGRLHALQSLLYILVVALFVMTFTVQPFRIPSESMEPTLLVGDFILVEKQLWTSGNGAPLGAVNITRRDVIVFHYPVDARLHLVKRVIGLPGERLRMREGRVYINGRPLQESYAVYRAAEPDSFRDNFPRLERANPSVASAWWIQMHRLVEGGELMVPENSYFVMGDNRNDSEDSRYWGLVPRAAIVGKPLLVYFSIRERSEDEPAGTAVPRGISRYIRWNRIFKGIR